MAFLIYFEPDFNTKCDWNFIMYRCNFIIHIPKYIAELNYFYIYCVTKANNAFRWGGADRVAVYNSSLILYAILWKSCQNLLTDIQLCCREKLQLTGTKKNIHMCLILYFSLFHYTSRQPISVANLGWIVKHVKPLLSFILQVCVF